MASFVSTIIVPLYTICPRSLGPFFVATYRSRLLEHLTLNNDIKDIMSVAYTLSSVIDKVTLSIHISILPCYGRITVSRCMSTYKI